MIMFWWNRYEVYCGFSLKRFNEILNLLAAYEIEYTYDMGRGQMDGGQMRYIYIHRKDVKRFLEIKNSRSGRAGDDWLV